MRKHPFGSVVCSWLMLMLLWGCGGNSRSNNMTGSGSSDSSSGSNSSSNNSGSASGTNNAGSSNTGSAGDSGYSSGSSGATYIYAGIGTDGGGIVGFSQDTTGTLSPISGSPYIQQGSASMLASAVYKNYVYMANIPGSETNTGSRTQLIYYSADPTTGTLTQVGTPDAGVGTNGDSEVRSFWVNSTKNVMYGVFQYTISTYSLSSSGLPSFVSAVTPSTDSVWAFDYMPNGPFAYAAIQNGNPKTGFDSPQIVLLNIDGDGTLSVNRTVLTMNSGSGIAGDLKVDPSGKFVVVSNGTNNEKLSVYAIQSDGSLNEVAGSPFLTGSQQLRFLAFDSTGQYLYAVNQHAEQPQAEDMEVFSFDASTGKLTQIQDLNQPNEQIASWLTVDGNYVYLTNISGGAHSTITVFNRDPNTGQLTQASVNNSDKAIGETNVLHD